MSIGTIKWERWKDPLRATSREHSDYGSPVGQLMLSSAGASPVPEDLCVSSYYNFWVGHTNFKIMDKDIEEIVKIEGVESLNTQTRYRMRIAVAKAFSEKRVMGRISHLFVKKPKEDRFLDRFSKTLSAKSAFWVILRDDGGRLVSRCYANRRDYDSDVQQIKAKVVRKCL